MHDHASSSDSDNDEEEERDWSTSTQTKGVVDQLYIFDMLGVYVHVSILGACSLTYRPCVCILKVETDKMFIVITIIVLE